MESYVERRDGGYFVSGTRVSLDSVVIQFRNGRSSEAILESFPALGSLVRVYGAITFYLENTREVDEYLASQDERWRVMRERYPVPDDLRAKIEAARTRGDAA